MDAAKVREKFIKPKLVEVFGEAITTVLITQAIAAGMEGTTEEEKLTLMVKSICSDPQVINMWGVAQTERQRREWLRFL